MLLFLCLPFLIAQVKKYWSILLFLGMFLAHLSQCFPLHVSTHSAFNVLDIIFILVLSDRCNNWLTTWILHVVAIRSARAVKVLFKTKLCKSGSPSLTRAHIKLKSSSSVLTPCLTTRLLTTAFMRRASFAGALDALLSSSNFSNLTPHSIF